MRKLKIFILFSHIIAPEGFIGSVPDSELANQVCYRENKECAVRLPVVKNCYLVIYAPNVKEEQFGQLVQAASEYLKIPSASVCLLDLFKADLAGEGSQDKYHAFNEKCKKIHAIFEKANRIALIYEKSDFLTYYFKRDVDLSTSDSNFAKVFLHLYLIFQPISHMFVVLNDSKNLDHQRFKLAHELNEYEFYIYYSVGPYANCLEFIAPNLPEWKIMRMKDLLSVIDHY